MATILDGVASASLEVAACWLLRWAHLLYLELESDDDDNDLRRLRDVDDDEDDEAVADVDDDACSFLREPRGGVAAAFIVY